MAAFKIPLQGGGGDAAGNLRVSGQQGVRLAGKIELPLQVAEVEIDVGRRYLVRIQPEAAGAAVRHDRGDDGPQGLHHVFRGPAPEHCGSRHLGAARQRQQHRVPGRGAELPGQPFVQYCRRERALRIHRGEPALSSKKGVEAAVDPQDLHRGSGPGAGVDGGPLEEDDWRHPGAGAALIVYRQGGCKPGAKKTWGHEGAVDGAEAVENESAQAGAHRIADQQGPGQHRGRHRGTERDRGVDLPVVRQRSAHRP